MPAILIDAKLAYFFVPKVACTSLKTMFFELENGHSFTPYAVNGKRKTIHSLYGTSLFADLKRREFQDYTRLALVRDPVARVVSCYKDKILKKNLLSKPLVRKKLKRRDLPTQPSISEFVTHLDVYRKVSPAIRHHSHSLCTHLGKNPDYFTQIFPFSDMEGLVAEIARVTGKTPVLPHMQKGAQSEEPIVPSEADVARIHEIYAEDYEVYGDRF